jgi:hypothetical protein
VIMCDGSRLFGSHYTDMYLTCPVVYKGFWFVQCVGSRTDGMPTVDQSDMRGLGTA